MSRTCTMRLLAVLVMLPALLVMLAPNRVGAGPLSEVILFAAKTDRYTQIQMVRPDGRDLGFLIRLRGDCRQPDLCSRTGLVVFAVYEHGSWNLYRVDLSGRNLQRLTSSPSDDRHPSWSPDGTRIVFETNRWGAEELAIMKADGTDLRRLTSDQTINRFPTWSPDGSRIAFVGWRQGSSDLYTTPAENPGRATRITRNFYADVTPAWSPDSRHLVYGSWNHLRGFLAVIGPEGVPRRLLQGTESASYPAWSPDGRQLLFTARTGNGAALYTVPVEGGSPELFPTPPFTEVYDLVWKRRPLPW